MAVSGEFECFLLELLAPLGPVRAKRMFGGAGLFYRDLMFGLIADAEVYFKTDAESRKTYIAAGEGPFVYETRHGEKTLKAYYKVPEALFDEADILLEWAQQAVSVALTAADEKAAKMPKRGTKAAKKSVVAAFLFLTGGLFTDSGWAESRDPFYAGVKSVGVICRVEPAPAIDRREWQSHLCRELQSAISATGLGRLTGKTELLSIADSRRLQEDRITVLLHGRFETVSPPSGDGDALLALSLALYRPAEAGVEPRLFATLPAALLLKRMNWPENTETIGNRLKTMLTRVQP